MIDSITLWCIWKEMFARPQYRPFYSCRYSTYHLVKALAYPSEGCITGRFESSRAVTV